MSLHASAVATLRAWTAPSRDQERLRREYLDHLGGHPDALWKDGPPAHLTASCFVLDPAAERVLLTLHRKGRFWAQFGGHCERDDHDLAAAALREAREESGVPGLTLVTPSPGPPAPVDLDRHALAGAFGRCTEHLDVAFVATAPAGASPVASPESEDVAWWPVDALPAGVAADLPPRLARVAAMLRAQPPGAGGRASTCASTPWSCSTSGPGSTIPRSAAAETPSR